MRSPICESSHQPADDLAFERIVNTPKRGLGDKAVARIHHARAGAGHPADASPPRNCAIPTNSPVAARKSLGRLVGDIARWRDLSNSLAHPELCRQILDESGYTAMLAGGSLG